MSSQNGPDVLRIAGLRHEALSMLARGEKPNPREIRLILDAVRADSSHPYWDSRHASHKDVVELCADLVAVALHSEGVDFEAGASE